MKWSRKIDSDGGVDYVSGHYSITWVYRGNGTSNREWRLEFFGEQIKVFRTLAQAKSFAAGMEGETTLTAPPRGRSALEV